AVDDGIDLLCALDTKRSGYQPAAARRRFPVDLVDGVPGNVLTQVLEFAAAPHLPLNMQSRTAPGQEGRKQPAVGPEVGVNTDLALQGDRAADAPQAQW